MRILLEAKKPGCLTEGAALQQLLGEFLVANRFATSPVVGCETNGEQAILLVPYDQWVPALLCTVFIPCRRRILVVRCSYREAILFCQRYLSQEPNADLRRFSEIVHREARNRLPFIAEHVLFVA